MLEGIQYVTDYPPDVLKRLGNEEPHFYILGTYKHDSTTGDRRGYIQLVEASENEPEENARTQRANARTVTDGNLTHLLHPSSSKSGWSSPRSAPSLQHSHYGMGNCLRRSPLGRSLRFGYSYDVGSGVLDIETVKMNSDLFLCMCICADRKLRAYWIHHDHTARCVPGSKIPLGEPGSSHRPHGSSSEFWRRRLSLSHLSIIPACESEILSKMATAPDAPTSQYIGLALAVDSSSSAEEVEVRLYRKVISAVASCSDGYISSLTITATWRCQNDTTTAETSASTSSLSVESPLVGEQHNPPGGVFVEPLTAIISGVRMFKAHSAEVWTVCMHPYNKHLILSGADDSTMKLWDLRLVDWTASTQQMPIKANTSVHKAGVTKIKFIDNDPRVFATGSYDQEFRLWDIFDFTQPFYSQTLPGGVWRIRSCKTQLTCGSRVVRLSIAATFGGASVISFTVYEPQIKLKRSSTEALELTDIMRPEVASQFVFYRNRLIIAPQSRQFDNCKQFFVLSSAKDSSNLCPLVQYPVHRTRSFDSDRKFSCKARSLSSIFVPPPVPKADLLIYDVQSCRHYDIVVSFYERTLTLIYNSQLHDILDS